MAAERLTTEIRGLSLRELDAIGPQWRELERVSAPPHYSLAHAWLVAWATVYRPHGLLLVRVSSTRGTARALGLIEVQPGRRWRFAGGAVTPARRLLCDPVSERAVWTAWGTWLAEHRSRWSILEAGGVPEAAAAVPGATLEPVPDFALSLPDSFDAYLAGRSSGTRRGLRQKLNRLGRFDAAVREVARPEHAAALRRFVTLHGARAAQKGERHPSVDTRLVELLLSLGGASEGAPRLRLFELTAGERAVGVSVRLDHGTTGYFYNAGFDPAAAAMSPGIVLELVSIRNAIETGLTCFDLGPGDHRYKRDLGGERRTASRLVATSRSPLGALAQAAYRVRRAVRARRA